MGITILDEITLTNGIKITNSYGSLGLNNIKIRKLSADSFKITSLAYIWVNQTKRNEEVNNGMDPRFVCHKQTIDFNITASELTSNLYTLVYDQWKLKYSNTTNV